MFDKETANLLARYKAWADQLTFDAVASLPAGEVTRERPTHFKSIIGTLNHTYVVDLIWQANLEGRPHGFSARNLVLHPELPALWLAQQKANEWLIAWAQGQSASSLQEIVTFRLVSGKKGSMTRAQILMHIVNHATYHRGWVSDLFFQIPAKPPTTDWNVFLSDAAMP